MTELARGEIDINLNDEAARAGLVRLEAEYRAAMSAIDRMEAKAKIDADREAFDRKLREAKAELKTWQSEKANAAVGADTKDFDEAIKKVRAEIARLEAQKATIEIDTKGAEKALAQEAALAKAEAARARAEDQYARKRNQIAVQQQRAADTEHAMNERVAMDDARRAERITNLQKEYSKLTDRIEKLDKRQRGFEGSGLRREVKAKLDIDAAGAAAKMVRIKAELNALGGRPPVNIKVDTDRSDMSRMRRTVSVIGGDLNKMIDRGLEGLSKVGQIRVMGNNLKTVAAVAATLSPVLVSLGGAATSLVGVLGTGLAGAAAVAGGTVAGLALNFGGVLMALKPTIANFKMAQAATLAYTKAVDKYGKDSKQAKTAQDQMNSVLRAVDPNARRAAIGLAQMQSNWTKLTQGTATRDFGAVMAGGVRAATALMPTLARNTNQTMDIVTAHLTHLEGRLSKPANVHLFDSLGRSANRFLDPALAGLGHLGAAFGHVAESAARLFSGRAGRSFDDWAKSIDNATKPGAKLDAEIMRLGTHARDVGRFFMAAGRLIMTVLNGGADAGDRMANSMTDAMNRWSDFLQSTEGHKGMEDFFKRSEGGARSLWAALSPLVAAFVQWSSMLAPFTSGLLIGISFISRLVAGFTKLVGMGPGITALGATFGVIFALGKVSAFAAMVARIVVLLRDAAAAARGLGILGGIGAMTKSVGLGLAGAIKGPGSTVASMTEGGAAAGAEIRGAMAAGGAAAAAEIRSAMIGGGAAAAAEEGAGAAAGGIAGAAEGAAGAAALAGEAEVAGAAVAGLGVAGTVAATGGVALLAAGAIYLGIKLLDTKSASDKLHDSIKAQNNAETNYTRTVQGMAGTYSRAGAAVNQYRNSGRQLAQLQRELNTLSSQGKRGTQEYRDTLSTFNSVYRQHNQDMQAAKKYQTAMMTDQVKTIPDALDRQARAQKTLRQAEAELDRLRNTAAGHNPVERQRAIAAALQNVRDAQALVNRTTGDFNAAADKATIASMDYQRTLRGMVPLSEQAAASLAKLSKQNPNVAAKISVKYEDPKDAGHVAAAAQKAIGGGVTVKSVMKIIADSSNADQALARLRAATITAKRLRIEGDESDAMQALNRVKGAGVPTKIMKMIGDVQDAIRKHGIVKSLPNLQKLLSMLGRDVSAHPTWARISALANLSKVLSMLGHDTGAKSLYDYLAAQPDIVKTYTLVVRQSGSLSGNLPKGVSPVSRAAGGPHDGLAAAGPQSYTAKYMNQIAASAGPLQTTRGGHYRNPALLVGEENRSEYVISTNPAYGENNRRYLAEAADAMGLMVVEPFAVSGAKHPPKKHPPKHPKKRQQIKLVDPPRLQGDYIEQSYGDLSDALNKYARAHASDQGKIGKQEDRITQAKKAHVSKNGKAAHEQKLKTMDRDLRRLRADDAKQQREYVRTLPKFEKIRTIYQDYVQKKNDAERLTTDMNTYATHFNHGDPGDWERSWQTAHDQRVGALKDIQGDLKAAMRIAPKKWKAALEAQLSDFSGQQVTEEDTDEGTVLTGPDAGPDMPTDLEGLLKIGAFGGLNMDMLSGMQAALAVAGTTPDTADDIAAANALVGFYRNALGQAGTMGGLGVTDRNDLITEIAGDLKDAQSTADQSVSTGGLGNDDAQAQLEQAQEQARIATATVATQGAFIQTALSAGDIGSGSGYSTAWSSAGGSVRAADGSPLGTTPGAPPAGSAGSAAQTGGTAAPAVVVQQTINTLHPGDPATLRAVGDAAVSGFGYQGNVAAPREYTGV